MFLIHLVYDYQYCNILVGFVYNIGQIMDRLYNNFAFGDDILEKELKELWTCLI